MLWPQAGGVCIVLALPEGLIRRALWEPLPLHFVCRRWRRPSCYGRSAWGLPGIARRVKRLRPAA